MRDIGELLKCRSCGAPVTSEICPYCGNPTGLITEQADMEYPVIECKEANLTFWNVLFPAIFAVGFGFFGFLFPFLFSGNEDVSLIMFVPFMLIGLGAAFITLRSISRFVTLKLHGKKITAKVYGYMDDNILLNGVPAQIVKLLVQTPDGPRFILYQLGDTKQIYGVNTHINVMVYKNYFMIDKSGEKVSWE